MNWFWKRSSSFTTICAKPPAGSDWYQISNGVFFANFFWPLISLNMFLIITWHHSKWLTKFHQILLHSTSYDIFLEWKHQESVCLKSCLKFCPNLVWPFIMQVCTEHICVVRKIAKKWQQNCCYFCNFVKYIGSGMMWFWINLFYCKNCYHLHQEQDLLIPLYMFTMKTYIGPSAN